MHLLQHFNALSLRPENAQEIRGLILELAIRGRLTQEWRANNPDAEPAAELLKRIKKEKARLVKEKVIRKEKVLPEVEEEEQPFGLPEGWVWCRLGDIITRIVGGGTPSKSNPNYWNGSIPWASVKDLKSYKYLEKTKDSITTAGLDNSSSNTVKKGDIILCTRMGLGKIAICNIETAINQDLKAISLHSDISTDYFYYSYKTFNLTGSGVTVKGIKQHELLNLEYPLPPLPEQKAIVEIVNRLLAEVDQLEQRTTHYRTLRQDYVTVSLRALTGEDSRGAWAELRPHFQSFFERTNGVEKLRAAILELAVQGKLTKEWRANNPDVEPAAELLKRIKKEKARLVKEKVIRKEKALPEVDMKEVPFEVPKGWVWCKLGEVLKQMAYGTSQKASLNSSLVPVLRMGNITSQGKLDFRNLKYVSPDIKDLPKLFLENGDIVFNRTNSYALVGKCGVYRSGPNTYTLASYLIKVSPMLEHTSSEFINLFINSPVCRKTQIEPQITALTNQANFSGSKLKNMTLPLPPLPEQKAIVEIVDELLALCDRLQAQLDAREVVTKDFLRASVREVLEA